MVKPNRMKMPICPKKTSQNSGKNSLRRLKTSPTRRAISKTLQDKAYRKRSPRPRQHGVVPARNGMIGRSARRQGSRRSQFAICVFGAATLLTSCHMLCHTPSERRPPKHIQTDETVVVCVPARSKWTSTGILVERDEIYHFESAPPDRWYDFFVASTAAGYKSLPFQRRFESRRRVPSAPWFALCGAIGPSGK